MIGFAAALLLAGPGWIWAQEAAPTEEGITVQARGPVHEAFAQPAGTNARPGPIVPRRPPPPVPEEPPEQKPEGDNVQFLPGYWGWDVDREDFLWVSGCWRVPPPNRRWVPGHWSEVEGGWQWAPGFWAPLDQEEIPYLESPPVSLDYGPVVPMPDDSSIYVPGCWVPRAERYLWRPGFWLAARPGWLWCPAHYTWTPRGPVFVDGFWDRPLEERGLLFAPVAFDRPLWATPGWHFRPRFTVGLGGLLASFFARPAWGQYYFGDYYDPSYARLGFQPWHAFGSRSHDPLYGYYRWQHRDEPSWQSGLSAGFLARRNGEQPRPPRTLVEQNRLIQVNGPGATGLLQMVRPLNEFSRADPRVTTLGATQRLEQRAAVQRFHDVAVRRTELEKFNAPRSDVSAAQRRSTLVAGTLQLPAENRPGRVAAPDSHQGIVPRPMPRPFEAAPDGSSRSRSAAPFRPELRTPATVPAPERRQANSAPVSRPQESAPPPASRPAFTPPGPRAAPAAAYQPPPPVVRQQFSAPPPPRRPAVSAPPAPRAAPAAHQPPPPRAHAPPPPARHQAAPPAPAKGKGSKK